MPTSTHVLPAQVDTRLGAAVLESPAPLGHFSAPLTINPGHPPLKGSFFWPRHGQDDVTSQTGRCIAEKRPLLVPIRGWKSFSRPPASPLLASRGPRRLPANIWRQEVVHDWLPSLAGAHCKTD